MYKIFLVFLSVLSLYGGVVDGVAIVVKGDAITLFDIKQEMKTAHVDAKKASDILIRKKLEAQEIKERKIVVTSEEVYEDLKKTAARNKLSLSEFYDAVRNSSGLNSSELKAKVKEKLLSQKLYSAIAYATISLPDEHEIEEYYNIHKEKFAHPSAFKVIIYGAADKQRLQEKIDNPMFYTPEVKTNEQTLPYDRITPELASLLQKTKLNTFTPIIPNGRGGFMSFYLKEVVGASEVGLEGVKNQVINLLMAQKRESVLGDYFARLRNNADIKVIRMPKE